MFGERSPHCLAVTVGEKFCMVENLDAWRLESSDRKFAIPFVYDVVRATPAKHNTFHGCACWHSLHTKMILIALIQHSLKIVRVRSEPSPHIRP